MKKRVQNIKGFKRVYTQKPGRKAKLSPCEWCKKEFGVNAMRAHRPDCPKRSR